MAGCVYGLLWVDENRFLQDRTNGSQWAKYPDSSGRGTLTELHPGALGAGTSRLKYRTEWSIVATWMLGFGLVLYLSLKGGGYDPVVNGETGIVVWWIVVVGVLAGAMPVRKPSRPVLIALGLLGGFAVWTALGLISTESSERTARELARALAYLGVFALALMIRGSRAARHMISAVGTAIAVVALIALASRLRPEWFPEAAETVRFLSGAQNRLSFPLNYWNGLAELIAIGLPLMLYMATSTRNILLRSFMGGLIPAVALAAFFTFSRTGLTAIVLGPVIFLAFSNDRVAKFSGLLVTGAGSAVLVIAATSRGALESGLAGPVGIEQGKELFTLTIIVCAVVAVGQGLLSWFLAERSTPRILSPTREESRYIVAVGIGLLIAAGLAFGATSSVSERWDDFKSVENPGQGMARLESVAGNGRYQYWSAAVDQFSSEPLTGTGSGTFELWWARNGDIPGFLRDTHSLYFQTLGETGLIGLLLLLGFLGVVIVGGILRVRTSASRRKGQLAAALGGCVAFVVAAGVDWSWQVPAIPVSFLLLGAVLLTAERASPLSGFSWKLRAPIAVIGALVIVVIAVPTASISLVRQSQSEFKSGDLGSALRLARSAANVQPGAASPRLQEALVLELGGNLKGAAAAARQAIEREPTNWRHWVILSRIEAERGQVDESIDAYRKARSLNPRGLVFSR